MTSLDTSTLGENEWCTLAIGVLQSKKKIVESEHVALVSWYKHLCSRIACAPLRADLRGSTAVQAACHDEEYLGWYALIQSAFQTKVFAVSGFPMDAASLTSRAKEADEAQVLTSKVASGGTASLESAQELFGKLLIFCRSVEALPKEPFVDLLRDVCKAWLETISSCLKATTFPVPADGVARKNVELVCNAMQHVRNAAPAMTELFGGSAGEACEVIS